MSRPAPDLDAAPSAPPRPGPIAVLIVDDDPRIHLLVRTYLARLGERYTLDARDDYATGREALLGGEYDVCLLDYALGDRIGPDLIRDVREAGCRIPIVMLTGRTDAASDRDAMDAGAEDYLVKGKIDADSLDRTLRYTLEQVRVREALVESQARLADTVARLARSRSDLRTLLDHLRMGAAIVDGDGRVSFLSAPAARLFGRTRETVIGRRLADLGRLEPDALVALEEMADRAPDAREKLAVTLSASRGAQYHVEIDIVDDPRDETRRMYFFYDVTEVQTLRRQLDDKPRFHDIIGRSAPMRALFDQIREVAIFDSTVLVEGETGSGKELVGRALHAASNRAAGPYIPVNSAGLTDSLLGSQLFGHRKGAFTGAHEDHVGFFEAADGGTLFLDEIGDIPMSVQTRLLRVLQEREVTRLGESKPRKVDVRVIAATHRDLAAEVAAGRFRMDLLYRIRVARLRIPPLRERLDDLPLLVDTFLADLRQRTGKQVTHISHEAMGLLLKHDWPGNVRELRGAVEAAFIRARGATLEAAHLPEEFSAAPAARAAPGPALQGDEPTRIRAALEATGGRRAEAAKLLGISRATFYRRLAQYDIDPNG